MKRAIVILTSLLALQAYGQTRDWENPAVLGIHKLPYHATLGNGSFIGVRRQNHVLQTSIVRITT